MVYPVSTKQIVINHYYIKSREEFTLKKTPRGRACNGRVPYNFEQFKAYDRNEVFDDGILKYRAARAQNFSFESDDHRINRVINALVENLTAEKISLETALTCRALAEKFQIKIGAYSAEEFALTSIYKILTAGGISTYADGQLFIRELPKLLRLPYPVAKKLRDVMPQFISKFMKQMCLNDMWKDFFELDLLSDILKEE